MKRGDVVRKFLVIVFLSLILIAVIFNSKSEKYETFLKDCSLKMSNGMTEKQVEKIFGFDADTYSKLEINDNIIKTKIYKDEYFKITMSYKNNVLTNFKVFDLRS